MLFMSRRMRGQLASTPIASLEFLACSADGRKWIAWRGWWNYTSTNSGILGYPITCPKDSGLRSLIADGPIMAVETTNLALHSPDLCFERFGAHGSDQRTVCIGSIASSADGTNWWRPQRSRRTLWCNLHVADSAQIGC